MKYLTILTALVFSIPLLNSCGSDPCETVECVNGDCNNEGKCDCDAGWTGPLCADEAVPYSINVSKMVIEKFSPMDGSKEWDDEDDGSKGDITMRVYDITNKYFEPTDLVNQMHENADGSMALEIPCNFKLRDMESDVTFEVVDYDFDDNFNVIFEFISSVSTKFNGLYKNFPETITLVSGTKRTKLTLHVTYTY
ncbi:MAG: calcium-binding EGF-like domain-containing protein [Bacteroidia bacterium]